MPLGMRRQVSFEAEPVSGTWSPKGDVLLVSMDRGGSEFYQLYTLKDGRLTLKTDQKPARVVLWQATNPDARDFRNAVDRLQEADPVVVRAAVPVRHDLLGDDGGQPLRAQRGPDHAGVRVVALAVHPDLAGRPRLRRGPLDGGDDVELLTRAQDVQAAGAAAIARRSPRRKDELMSKLRRCARGAEEQLGCLVHERVELRRAHQVRGAGTGQVDVDDLLDPPRIDRQARRLGCTERESGCTERFGGPDPMLRPIIGSRHLQDAMRPRVEGLQILATARDISERKRTEAAVQQSQARASQALARDLGKQAFGGGAVVEAAQRQAVAQLRHLADVLEGDAFAPQELPQEPGPQLPWRPPLPLPQPLPWPWPGRTSRRARPSKRWHRAC